MKREFKVGDEVYCNGKRDTVVALQPDDPDGYDLVLKEEGTQSSSGVFHFTYKLTTNSNRDIYVSDKSEAEKRFREYIDMYGDGIRLYEAVDDGGDDAPEWDIIDCHDQE